MTKATVAIIARSSILYDSNRPDHEGRRGTDHRSDTKKTEKKAVEKRKKSSNREKFTRKEVKGSDSANWRCIRH